MIECQSAKAPRLDEHSQDETRVVGFCVEIGPAAFSPLGDRIGACSSSEAASCQRRVRAPAKTS